MAEHVYDKLREHYVVGPHGFVHHGWRFWLCVHCYAPRQLHPRVSWVRARKVMDRLYLSQDAPHFEEGW